MTVFFTFLSSLIFIITFISFLKLPHWSIRGWEFPRIQFSTILFFLIILEVFILDSSNISSYAFLFIAILCFIFQVKWIIPYTFLYEKEVYNTNSYSENNSIKIITANVLTPNENKKGFLKLITKYNPDVLVTLESDKSWEKELDSLEKEYKYTVKCPLDNLYGMHVYSKYPLHEKQIEYLVQENVPSIHTIIQLPSGIKVRTHFLHPAPPSPTENTHSTQRDAELIVVAKSIKNAKLPVIVTGDLNDVAWSYTTRLFKNISKLLDPRIGRRVLNTYNAKHWFLRWPLDHLFHSKEFTLVKIERLPFYGSDHFAIFTHLCFEKKDKQNEKKEQDLNKEDEDFIEDKLNSQNVEEKDVPNIGEESEK